MIRWTITTGLVPDTVPAAAAGGFGFAFSTAQEDRKLRTPAA
jgi:hypothetical protein